MKISKKLFRNAIVKHLLCFLLSLYIRLVYHTGKWQVINRPAPSAPNGSGELFAFWHGRLFLMPCIASDPSHMLTVISPHADGEILALVIRHFGFGFIHGSTDRGGRAAIRDIIKALKSGKQVGITPDGPRGPRMRINSNIIPIARITGARIIPVTFSAANARVFHSWDRFLLPKPFGKGFIIFGDSIIVPPDAADDALIALKHSLENTLNIITLQADTLAAIVPVIPDSPDTPPKKRKVAL